MGFIEDAVQNISKEVGKIQSRSQEMLQGYNLQSQIRDLERQKTTKLIDIGHSVYRKYHQNQDITEEILKERVFDIVAIEKEITTLQTELDSMRVANDPETPHSQRADNKAGYKTTPGFECPKCHAPASRDKAFCPACGESLKSANGDSDDVVDVTEKN